MTDAQRLAALFRAQHKIVSIVTPEEEEAFALVRDVATQHRAELWQWSASFGLRTGLMSRAAPVANTEVAANALLHMLSRQRADLLVMFDLFSHLSDGRTLRLLRDLVLHNRQFHGNIVLIDHGGEPPAILRTMATPFQLSLPDEAAIEKLVQETLAACDRKSVKIDIPAADLQTVVRNLRGLTKAQARQVIVDAVCDDLVFDSRDVNTVLAAKRKLLQGSGPLEYVEAPVDLSEVGGLDRLKAWLRQRQDALSNEAAKFGIKAPRGVLLLGVQGGGKSLASKAVATAWGRPLLRMDVGALYDKYIGETERMLRDALRQAEAMAPIVLWIDEVEKAFASTNSHGADGGLSKRMFASLLTWMQEHKAPVFLVATANDIEALPPELLRKGRFDEIFFVDLPRADARSGIFAIHLRKRQRDPERFDLSRLAEATEGFSGSEIEQAVTSALHDAFDSRTQLSTEHLLAAVKRSPPLSVTMAEKIAALRDWARGRCVPAD
jgi:AAA+ superfamily predicted ATPase